MVLNMRAFSCVAASLLVASALWCVVDAFVTRPVPATPTQLHAAAGPTGAKPMRVKDVKRLIKRTPKEKFEAEVLQSEVQAWLLNNAGSSLFPKLKKRILRRATELGVEAPKDWAAKPYTGPPLWLKAEAAEALKAATAARDKAQIEAAIEKAENLEGIEFVKEGQESSVLNEARATLEAIEAEISAKEKEAEEAAAAAAAAAAAPEDSEEAGEASEPAAGSD